MYFKSKWKYQFEERDTKIEKFYNSDKQIQTKIMHQNGGYKSVCIAKEYAIYDLPFNSSLAGDSKGAYKMRIVLPTIDKNHPMNNRMALLKSVEKQLSGDLTSGCRYSSYDNVFVSMPKFKLQPETMNINKMLKTMGMKKAFSSDGAQFYAMPNTTPMPSDRTPYLYISSIYHKAFIEIDENGGEAAAATAVVMSESQSIGPQIPDKNYYFTVDHPFIYMIIEQSTGAAIFMGRVTDL